METELVTVVVGGQSFTGWKEVAVRAAVNEACRSYTLKVAGPVRALDAYSPFQDFTPLQILAGGDLLLDGYVDRRQPVLGAEQAEISIEGRSKGQDAVDCSAVHDTGRFENKSALDIAKEIDTYGVGYSSDAQLEKIEEHQLTPGETVHREVERLCRDEGLTLFGQADGSVKLWNADSNLKRQSGAIIEGVNLFEGSADHNCSNRHSHTHVRGQSAKGNGREVHQLESIAQDSGVKRTRRVVHIHDGNTDAKRVKKRAEHRRDRAAGNGLKAEIVMYGWRDDGGQLWEPGNRVWVESPFLDIAQDMLIEAVTYIQKDSDGEGNGKASGGTTAILELVDPRAYAGNAPGRSSSGSEWNIDDSGAS